VEDEALREALEPAQARVLALETELAASAERRSALRVELELSSAREEAIAQLVAGIGHDARSVFTAILLCSRRLCSVEGVLEVPDLLKVIEDSAEHGLALTHQLLMLSSGNVVEPASVGLNDAVRCADHLIRGLLPAGIRLVAELTPGLGPVRLARGELERILVNLVTNACDAMPEGGTVTIETRTTEGEDDGSREGGRSGTRAWAVLTVADTGPGMPLAVAERAFAMGFTTKPEADRGIGLANVQQIVTGAGGQLEVGSAPGGGTALRVFLPSVHDPDPLDAAS